MASHLAQAMARLKHRDIRTRRRAVRTLFEANDPSALSAFETLLSDDDPWFVSKALDAYRLWAPMVGQEAVQTLLLHDSLNVQRAGAQMLAQFGENGEEIALAALENPDSYIHKQAAKALLLLEPTQHLNRLAGHPSPFVRTFVLGHPQCDELMTLQFMQDEDLSVRTAALQRILEREYHVDQSMLLPFFNADILAVPILMWMVKNDDRHLKTFIEKMKSHHVHDLSEVLRHQAGDSQHALIQSFLASELLSPVARWVARQGHAEDELRWRLIESPKLEIIERCKLLERLLSRAAEPEVQQHVTAFMATCDEPILRNACENLSTAATELRS